MLPSDPIYVFALVTGLFHLTFKELGDLNIPKSWTDKDEKMYNHVKSSEKEEGRSEKDAERIAGATMNKHRKSEGRTKK